MEVKMQSTNDKRVGDDFGNFAQTESAQNKPKKTKSVSYQNQSYSKPKKSGSGIGKVIAIAVIIIVVLIAVFAGIVALSKMPKSSSKVDDTVYFTYIDESEKYHVVVDGQEISKTFENEIELIPAEDNSFAYILEKVEEDVNGASGIRIHILKGKKLQTSGGLADECIAFSKLKPMQIYLLYCLSYVF